MRKREVVKAIKDVREDLRKASPGLFSSFPTAQMQSERRLVALHQLERLLPEIIEKLEAGQ